jgi:hypothetical protein
MKSETGAAATFITFYSFKGGVGRSMALINTAGILAGHRGFRVLVLDLDLEAPGLTYLDPESPDATKVQRQGELPLQLGFVDLITDALERGEAADLFTLSPTDLDAKYTRKIKIPDQRYTLCPPGALITITLLGWTHSISTNFTVRDWANHLFAHSRNA